MFHCVFGPLLVQLCALCVPVQLYEIMMMMMMTIYKGMCVLNSKFYGSLQFDSSGQGTFIYLEDTNV